MLSDLELRELRIFERVAEPTLAAGEDDRIAYANAAAHQLLGWPDQALIGQRLPAIMPERFHAAHEAGFHRYLSTDQSRIIGRPVRVAAVRRDGRELDIELTLSALSLVSGKRVFLAFLRDRSAIVELERQGELLGLLEAVLESAPVGLGFVDRTLRYVRVNQTFAEIDGVSVEDHVGKSLAEVHPKLWSQVEPIYRRALDEGRASVDREIEGELTTTPGPLRQFLASHVPVRDQAGQIIGVGIMLREVTERKEAEREREHLLAEQQLARDEAERQRQYLHSLFMQAPVAIAILRGPDHVYELSNAINNMALGKDPTGLSVREAFPETVEQGYLAILDRVYQTGQRYQVSEARIVFETASGPVERYVNGIYQPMRGAGGTIEGVLVFGFEVTEQVHARKRTEVAENELREAVRVRDEFLSIASHELKTPLAALKLQIQSLRRMKLGDAASLERLAERLAKTDGQVARLEALVNELLEVSRITSGRATLDRTPVDLAALTSEIIDRFGPQLGQARCEINLHAPVAPVTGSWDRFRLDQVVSNLISNAIKYGAGKPIEVAVELMGDKARFSVRDHGIGIPIEAQNRVFERFERAVSGQHFGGFGLGLWIARQNVEAHGGTISSESTPGVGSKFTFVLPREPA